MFLRGIGGGLGTERQGDGEASRDLGGGKAFHAVVPDWGGGKKREEGRWRVMLLLTPWRERMEGRTSSERASGMCGSVWGW